MPYPVLSPGLAAHLFPSAAMLAEEDDHEADADEIYTAAMDVARAVAEASRILRDAVAKFRSAHPSVCVDSMPVPHGCSTTVEEMLTGCEADATNPDGYDFQSALSHWVYENGDV